MDLDSQLRIVAEHAETLRTRGVATVRISPDYVEFTLHPHEPAAPTSTTVTEDRGDAPAPLNDHTTYGFAEGSKLPGFVDPRKAGS